MNRWNRWRRARRSLLLLLPEISYGTTMVASGRRASRRPQRLELVSRTRELFG